MLRFCILYNRVTVTHFIRKPALKCLIRRVVAAKRTQQKRNTRINWEKNKKRQTNGKATNNEAAVYWSYVAINAKRRRNSSQYNRKVENAQCLDSLSDDVDFTFFTRFRRSIFVWFCLTKFSSNVFLFMFNQSILLCAQKLTRELANLVCRTYGIT